MVQPKYKTVWDIPRRSVDVDKTRSHWNFAGTICLTVHRDSVNMPTLLHGRKLHENSWSLVVIFSGYFLPSVSALRIMQREDESMFREYNNAPWRTVDERQTSINTGGGNVNFKESIINEEMYVEFCATRQAASGLRWIHFTLFSPVYLSRKMNTQNAKKYLCFTILGIDQ